MLRVVELKKRKIVNDLKGVHKTPKDHVWASSKSIYCQNDQNCDLNGFFNACSCLSDSFCLCWVTLSVIKVPINLLSWKFSPIFIIKSRLLKFDHYFFLLRPCQLSVNDLQLNGCLGVPPYVSNLKSYLLSRRPCDCNSELALVQRELSHGRTKSDGNSVVSADESDLSCWSFSTNRSISIIFASPSAINLAVAASIIWDLIIVIAYLIDINKPVSTKRRANWFHREVFLAFIVWVYATRGASIVVDGVSVITLLVSCFYPVFTNSVTNSVGRDGNIVVASVAQKLVWAVSFATKIFNFAIS